MVNPRVIRNAIKYGPVIAGAAKKYGPSLVQEARKHAPAVVDEVERRTGRRVPGATGGRTADMADATPRQTGSFVDHTPLGGAAAKRRATHHARAVVEGSMLQTFIHSRPVWVVFSGDTPVGTHPHVDTPFSELLRHADLDATCGCWRTRSTCSCAAPATVAEAAAFPSGTPPPQLVRADTGLQPPGDGQLVRRSGGLRPQDRRGAVASEPGRGRLYRAIGLQRRAVCPDRSGRTRLHSLTSG